jgi:hypothetical protein
MNYPQIDHALTFLTKPGDAITLQVPYHRDIDLVVRHIIDRMGKPLNFWTPTYRRTVTRMEYPNGVIRFESLASDVCGIGEDCVFFIDRDHDRSYYEWLEV